MGTTKLSNRRQERRKDISEGEVAMSLLALSQADRNWFPVPAGVGEETARNAGFLVNAASSHVLVSEIKSCMSRCKLLERKTANGSLNQLWCLICGHLLG